MIHMRINLGERVVIFDFLKQFFEGQLKLSR